MSESLEAKPTLLLERHLSLGAKMAPFGGFLMPIQYSGIVREHEAVRTATGLFDTCHMGEFHFTGTEAVADLERLVSCNVASLGIGQCRYGLLCNPAGGVIDDLILYRKGDAEFMMVVNAGTQAGDLAWIRDHLRAGTDVTDLSGETGKLDLQGPGAPAMLAGLLDVPFNGLKYFRFMDNTLEGEPVLVSRTGYTGEIGFELYASESMTLRLWDRLLEGGAQPAGLGARDTLRLEVGLPLYGHEMDVKRNAAESGFTSVLSSDKDFVGCESVRRVSPSSSSLMGVLLEGRRAAREGDVVQLAGGEAVGVVTSGSFAPSLGCAIALAYIRCAHADAGRAVEVVTARQVLSGKLVHTPFYRNGTVRKALINFLEKLHESE